MTGRGRSSVERGENLYTKEWSIESGNNPVISWCTSSRTWGKVKDNRISNEELLVARGDERYEKIYRGLWYVSKNKEQDRRVCRKVEVEWGSRKTINTSNSGFYYEVIVSSWKRCNSSGLWQVVQNDSFYFNNGRNDSRRASKIVQRQCVEVTWVTRECNIGQKTTVCSRVG